MIKIHIYNPDISDNEKTYLSSPVSATGTTLTVRNTASIVAADYIVVGKPGREHAEQVSVTSADTDTQFTISALNFDHSTDESVIFTDFTQIQISMATTLTGTYNLQATVDIAWDSDVTEWVDLDGESTYYYKWRFSNPIAGTTSDYSDPVPGTDWAYNTVATIINEVLKECKDEEEVITTREELLTWINDCERDIKSRKKKLQDLKTSTSLTQTADVETVSLPSDFDLIDYLEYHYDDDSDETVEQVYRLRYITPIEFDYITQSKELDSSDALEKFTIDEVNQTIRLYPIPATTGSTTTGSYLTIYYYKDLTRVESDGDTVAFKNPKLYKDFCGEKFYRKKAEGATSNGSLYINIADRYKNDYERGIIDLIRCEPDETSKPKGFNYNPSRTRRFYKY